MTTGSAGSTEPVVTAADVAAWLRMDVDPVSASWYVNAAMLACRAVARPVPADAAAIVVAVAARGYANPTSRISEGAGPFNAAWGKSGIFVTDDERAALLSLAQSAAGATGWGAFTIDPTPVGAHVPWGPIDGTDDGWIGGYGTGTYVGFGSS